MDSAEHFDATARAAVKRLSGEWAVRQHVMLDELEALEELLARNVGAKLAATYHQLKTSVSPLALGAAWGQPA